MAHVPRYFYMHRHPDSLLPVPMELDQELKWAQQRPGSMALDRPKALTVDDKEPFAASLTFTEERFRSVYAETHPHQCWQLNQNPESGFGASSTDHCLPTVIANAHLLYTERVSPARWLVGSEALCTQGFPVMPGLWGLDQADLWSLALCAFNLPREGRTSRRLMVQAGDSMNTMVMTVLALHGLVAWDRKKVPNVIANIRLSRSAVRESVKGVKRGPVDFDSQIGPKRRLHNKTKDSVNTFADLLNRKNGNE